MQFYMLTSLYVSIYITYIHKYVSICKYIFISICIHVMFLN